MPVKWTPETDQILLLKILETSAINVDVKAISTAWPKDMEVPTPRAISERLVKIRTMAKANFTVSSGKNTSAPPTPRKKVKKEPVPKKAGGGIVKKKGIAKPKRAGKFESNSEEESGSNTVEYDNMDEVNPADDDHPQGEV